MSSLAAAQAVTPALRQADAAYRAGQAALSQHDLPSAQKHFEQVVHLVPGMEQGHSALGAVLLGRGHPSEAIRELEAALAITRSDTAAQTNLALAYQQTAQPARALPLFASLDAAAHAHNQPLSPAVVAAYARALAATGQIRQASLRMNSAVQAQPGNAELHDELGSLYALDHHWAPAQQEFNTAIQLDPTLAMPYLHLGLAMQAQRLDGTAPLEHAAQLAPDNVVINLELGKAYAASGHETQALACFQRLLDREPNSPEAMLQTALVLQRLDRSQEALALLQKVAAMQPDNTDALTNLGMALTQAQQARDALPLLQRAAALAPRSFVVHEDLAAAYIQLNQLDDAIGQLRQALALSPGAPQLHYDLAIAFKLKDQPASAIPEFETAEKLDPGSPEAPYALGLLYMQAGRYPEAARELKKSLDLRPRNGDGWATLGSVYNNLNMLPEATAALREATRQLPDQPEPHLTLAAVLIKQNQPAEATQERKIGAELMRAHMNEQRAEVAANAGNGLFKHGDLAAAADRFHDALTYDPNYRDAHLGLARVLEAQGKVLEAAAERKRAGSQPGTPNP